MQRKVHHLLKKQRHRPIGDAFLISCVSTVILRLKRHFLNYITLHRESLSSFHRITSEAFSALILRFPIGVHLWFLWTQDPLTRRFSFWPVWVQISAFAPFDFPLPSCRFSTSSSHSFPRCFYIKSPELRNKHELCQLFLSLHFTPVLHRKRPKCELKPRKQCRHDSWWNYWKFSIRLQQ